MRRLWFFLSNLRLMHLFCFPNQCVVIQLWCVIKLTIEGGHCFCRRPAGRRRGSWRLSCCRWWMTSWCWGFSRGRRSGWTSAAKRRPPSTSGRSRPAPPASSAAAIAGRTCSCCAGPSACSCRQNYPRPGCKLSIVLNHLEFECKHQHGISL